MPILDPATHIHALATETKDVHIDLPDPRPKCSKPHASRYRQRFQPAQLQASTSGQYRIRACLRPGSREGGRVSRLRGCLQRAVPIQVRLEGPLVADPRLQPDDPCLEGDRDRAGGRQATRPGQGLGPRVVADRACGGCGRTRLHLRDQPAVTDRIGELCTDRRRKVILQGDGVQDEVTHGEAGQAAGCGVGVLLAGGGLEREGRCDSLVSVHGHGALVARGRIAVGPADKLGVGSRARGQDDVGAMSHCFRAVIGSDSGIDRTSDARAGDRTCSSPCTCDGERAVDQVEGRGTSLVCVHGNVDGAARAGRTVTPASEDRVGSGSGSERDN